MKTILKLALVPLFTMQIIACAEQTEDGWTRWRGPNGNGTVTAEDFNPRFPEEETDALWHATIGSGYSSMSVQGDRLYTVGRVFDSGDSYDFLYCLDSSTGKSVWETEIPIGNPTYYPGPKAQPVLENGCLYYITPDAVAMAFKARNGKLLWRADLKELCGAVPAGWGVSGSPVISGEVMIVNACSGGVGLDTETGKVLWSTPEGVNGYASPVLLDTPEPDSVAVLGSSELFLLGIESGEILGTYPWGSEWSVSAADPEPVGESGLLLSSSYIESCITLDIKDGHLEPVWESDVLMSQFSSLVIKDSFLYGIDGSTLNRSRCYLKCIDPLTGEELWKSKMRAYGSLMLINETLVVLDEHGYLMTIKASPDGYELIRERRIFEERGSAWIAPVYDNGRLFVKNNIGEIVCLSVR